MKTKTLYFVLIATLLTAMACQNKKAETGENEVLEVSEENFAGSADFSVDTEVSAVDWVGRKVIGGKTHKGLFRLKEGSLFIKDGDLVGGKFTIDMTSLEVKDLTQENGKAKLEGHLKSPDFFEVENFPEAKFEIANVSSVDTVGGASHMISGNLDLKGVKKSLSFPASVRIMGNNVLATSLPFQINRTDWAVNYGSGLLGTIQDEAIADEVTLTIKIRAIVGEQELQ